jgi:16S rRNA (uracil1498-N3)-methyltransferase
MSISRIFQPIPLQTQMMIELDSQASHHIARVLRAAVGDPLTVFNGEGGEYQAVITQIDKKKVSAEVLSYVARDVESPLTLHLAQGISRGEKMDYTIQKAVELGVKKIIPLFTERCNVKLDEDRREKKWQHWQSIVISACEQSGRNHIPEIATPQSLEGWFATLESSDVYFVLAPTAQSKLKQLSLPPQSRVVLLIGPEGGLSDKEIARAHHFGFSSLNLGPRVLRTETAGVAALAALQCLFGDLG